MRFLVLAILVFAQLLNAQEAENASTPDPSLLTPKWWDVFVGEKAIVQQRSAELLNHLNPIPEDLSGPHQEEARNLIDSIKVNLQAWINIFDQPLPLSKPATTLKDFYTISQFRQLYSRLQKQQIDLESKKKEIFGLQQQLNTNRERLDAAWQGYQFAQDRSQEKILFGLKILKFRPAVEVGKKKIQLVNQAIKIEEQQIKNDKEEIQTAKNRLISTRADWINALNQLETLKRVWDDSKQERQRQEILYAEEHSEDPNEKDEAKNSLLTVNLINVFLKEMLAHFNYLRMEMIGKLSQLLEDPESVDIHELDVSLKHWKTQTRTFQLQLDDWKTQTERILQSASQVLTLEEINSPIGTTQLNEVIQKAQGILLEIQKIRSEFDETNFLLNTLDEKSIFLRGEGEQWFKVFIDFVSTLWQSANSQLSKTLFYIGTHPVSVITMIEFVMIMVATWWFSRVVTGTINTFSKRRKGIRKALIYSLNRLIHYFLLIIGGLIGLSWIGFDFSSFILIAGALGVGLGFGLQNIFNNFMSGIIILFQGHLKVGDYIELDSGLRGEIREINVTSTVVTTNDGIEVIIPNSEMVSNRIVNWTLRDPYRRVHVPFSVPFGSDVDKVTKIIVEAAKKVPSTLQRIGVREPQIFLVQLGDNGIQMELVVWVDEKWTRRNRNTQSQYLFAIEKALRENGINIPLPQRDIHLRTTALDK